MLNSITKGIWLISRDHARAYLPLALRIVRGEDISLPEATEKQRKKEDKGVFIVGTGAAGSFRSLAYDDYDEEKEQESHGANQYSTGIIRVIPIKGAITKNDPPCGYGLQSKMGWLKEAEGDKRVSAIILDIDSPGGEASYLETFSKQIKAMSKPVVACVNNMAASAGYWIAAGCDEVYTTEKGDLVGSIGVMITVMDWKGAFEKEGLKVHEIYATQSSAKNETYKSAIEGEYGPMRERILDPLANDFIDHVRGNRAVTDEMALSGRIYMSEEALRLGLIDGVKTFEEISERALELAEQSNNQQQQAMVITKNTHPNVLAAVGSEQMESHEEQVTLRLDELNELEAALSNTRGEEAEAELSKTKEKLEATEQALDQIRKQKVDLEAKLEQWAKEPAANTRGEMPPSDDSDKIEYKAGADAEKLGF